MPIYGYACKSCEHTFDALQKMSDPVLVDCPECGEAGLRKQLSAPKFRLKGKGWYETDFKTGDKKNLSGESDDTSGGKEKTTASDAKESGTADTKSAKATDGKKSTAESTSKSETA